MTIKRFKMLQVWLVLVLVVCAGCRAALRPGLPLAEDTTLTLEATPLENGEFALTGTTNLPDQTQLTVLALRYWTPNAASPELDQPRGAIPGQSTARSGPDAAPLYSVLDYQPVTVTKGEWSTQLQLWQVAADGRYQEPWQAQVETLNLAAQPRDTVQFAITLAPNHLGSALDTLLAQEGPQRIAGLLRVTPDGEPFLWAAQSLPVGLPQGQTTPPDLLARTNGGWGKRYLLVPEPPLPYTLTPDDQRQTTAPITLDEQLR